MARQNVQIRKTVYNREQAQRVIDTEFTTFNQPAPVDEGLTVEEFFAAYEELFLDIPLLGETNSHEFLLTRSGTLVNFERDTTDIQPLLDEIAQLRNQNLVAQQEIIDLNIQLASQGGRN